MSGNPPAATPARKKRPSLTSPTAPVPEDLDLDSPASVVDAVCTLRRYGHQRARQVLTCLTRSTLGQETRRAFHDHPEAFTNLVHLARAKRDVVRVCAVRVVTGLCYNDPVNAGHAVAADFLGAVAGMLTPLSTEGAQLEAATALMYITAVGPSNSGRGGSKLGGRALPDDTDEDESAPRAPKPRSALDMLGSNDPSCEELLPNLVDLLADHATIGDSDDAGAGGDPSSSHAGHALHPGVRQVLLRLAAQLAGFAPVRSRLVLLGCVNSVTPLIADSNPDTARCALLAVAGLSYDDTAREQLAEPWFLGTAAAIVSAGGDGDASDRERGNAMAQLASLSLASVSFNAATHPAVVKAGCVHALADGAEAGDEVTRRECLKALMNLAAWPGSYPAMRSSAIATMLAGFLAAHPFPRAGGNNNNNNGNSSGNSAGTQFLLLTLGTLAHCLVDPAMRDEYHQAGGLPPLVTALRSGLRAAAEIACSCIASLCETSPGPNSGANGGGVGNGSGGVGGGGGGGDLHHGSHSTGGGALGSSGSGSGSAAAAGLSGSSAPASAGSSSASSSRQQMATGDVDGARTAAVIDSGAVSCLLNLVSARGQPPTLRSRAARAIAAMCSHADARDILAVDHGIVGPLLEMMTPAEDDMVSGTKNSGDAGVTQDARDRASVACWLVQCVGRSRAVAQQVRELGGVSVMLQVVTSMPGEPRGAALRALATLVAFGGGISRVLINTGGAGVIVGLLEDDADPEATMRALVTIHNMCQDDGVRASLLDAGVVPLVAALANGTDPTTRGVAVRVLDIFGIRSEPESARESGGANDGHNRDGGASGIDTAAATSASSAEHGVAERERGEGGADGERTASAAAAAAASAAHGGVVSRAVSTVTLLPSYLYSMITLLFRWLYLMDDSRD